VLSTAKNCQPTIECFVGVTDVRATTVQNRFSRPVPIRTSELIGADFERVTGTPHYRGDEDVGDEADTCG